MTRRSSFHPSERHPRLFSRSADGRWEWWTEACGEPPPVYGERWAYTGGRAVRAIDPHRSKLGAALLRGWRGRLPRVGERWLYLGAASGTTASHVADLLGPHGHLYAVERSAGPFARLLSLADRWPPLLPILGDARRPRELLAWIPPVDGLYVDVAQPDQAEIVAEAAAWFLADGGALLFALKASSVARGPSPEDHLRATVDSLAASFQLDRPIDLAPFHRVHYFLSGEYRPSFDRRAQSSRGPRTDWRPGGARDGGPPRPDRPRLRVR